MVGGGESSRVGIKMPTVIMLRYSRGWLAVFSSFLKIKMYDFKKKDALFYLFENSFFLSAEMSIVYVMRNFCLWSRYNKKWPIIIFPLVLGRQ